MSEITHRITNRDLLRQRREYARQFHDLRHGAALVKEFSCTRSAIVLRDEARKVRTAWASLRRAS